jgi:hypothetical protein
VGAPENNLVVYIAAFPDLDTGVDQHAPPMMMEAGPGSYRSLCGQNTVEEDVKEHLDQARNKRHVMQVTPAGDRMKS